MTTSAEPRRIFPLVASTRHLWRFLLISGAVAAGMYFQSRRPYPAQAADGRLVLYAAFIASELLLAWFVLLGVRAGGGNWHDLIGRTWHGPLDVLRDFIIGAVTILVLKASSWPLLELVGSWQRRTGFLLPTTLSDRIVWIAVALAAGLCEEFVYRGYLQRQFQALSQSTVVAVLLQAVFFGALHLYQGWKPATIATWYGLIFGIIAAGRSSILPGAFAHAGIDLIGGLVSR